MVVSCHAMCGVLWVTRLEVVIVVVGTVLRCRRGQTGRSSSHGCGGLSVLKALLTASMVGTVGMAALFAWVSGVVALLVVSIVVDGYGGLGLVTRWCWAVGSLGWWGSMSATCLRGMVPLLPIASRL